MNKLSDEAKRCRTEGRHRWPYRESVFSSVKAVAPGTYTCSRCCTEVTVRTDGSCTYIYPPGFVERGPTRKEAT